MKTGGLGDVSGSLPAALKALRHDVRIILPAYREAKERAGRLTQIAQLYIPGTPGTVTLLEAWLPGTRIKTWLVDYAAAFDRSGDPYTDSNGHPWYDNAERFSLFCKVAVEVALGHSQLNWQPDIVHCNDWQTGLVPALLASRTLRPETVFTVHNLAYQGLFPYSTFATLGLPNTLWSLQAMEFYGQFSFIKGGLAFADTITTVSPTYAAEIQTPEFGCGLDALLRYRSDRLVGILNGIDEREWNPAQDIHLVKNYDVEHLGYKQENKLDLQKQAGLPVDPKIPLIGMVGRLVHQKGIDLLISALPQIMEHPLQMVILGSGESGYETALRNWAKHYPDHMWVKIGYDEALAHRIEGGADMFLMPSRFEPCGLNQLYSLRYGTVPIVRGIGGLADTVVDARDDHRKSRTATGILFKGEDPDALVGAIFRALTLYRKQRVWRRIVRTGMGQDFSWRHSARAYLQLYKGQLNQRAASHHHSHQHSRYQRTG